MKHFAFLLTALLLPAFASAQKLVDDREQASGWYVPVKVKVIAEGTDTKLVDVKVYKENKLVQELPGSKSKFAVSLDLGSSYTLLIGKDGYCTKSLTIDTHVPNDVVEYHGYGCLIKLDPEDRYNHSDPFYLDFPSVIVRWDKDARDFRPSEGYLADIQGKVAMLRAQMDTH